MRQAAGGAQRADHSGSLRQLQVADKIERVRQRQLFVAPKLPISVMCGTAT